MTTSKTEMAGAFAPASFVCASRIIDIRFFHFIYNSAFFVYNLNESNEPCEFGKRKIVCLQTHLPLHEFIGRRRMSGGHPFGADRSGA